MIYESKEIVIYKMGFDLSLRAFLGNNENDPFNNPSRLWNKYGDKLMVIHFWALVLKLVFDVSKKLGGFYAIIDLNVKLTDLL